MNKKLLSLLLVLSCLFSVICIPAASAAGTAPLAISIPAAAAVVSPQNGNGIIRVMSDVVVPAGETVYGDVVAIMGSVRVDGTVTGDVVAIMGSVDLNGTVDGDVIAVMGSTQVNSTVGGDLVCILSQVNLGAGGKIMGEIVEITNPANLNISGLDLGIRSIPFFRPNLGMRLLNAVVLFGLAALTLSLLPNQIETMAAAAAGDTGRKFLIGFITLLALPFAFFITGISLIGLPLLPVLAALLVIGKFLGYAAIALYVGRRIQQAGGMNGSAFLALLLGVLGLWLLRLVPFAGWLSSLAVTMLAFGLVIDTKFGTNRPWFRRKIPAPAYPEGRDAAPVIELPADVEEPKE